MQFDIRLRLTILDMQPIHPPVGGGRLRLLGLYHGLGDLWESTYVGTYDWPGPGYRNHMLSRSLREINIPLSREHFHASQCLQNQAGGRVVIDSAFADLVSLSPDFAAAAIEHAQRCEVVVFSHPWLYPLVREHLDFERQLVVYDAHNVEGLLRMKLLDDCGAGTKIARGVLRQEHMICQEADLILACSDEDRSLFHRLYGTPAAKVRVVPNGVFVGNIRAAEGARRLAARQRLGLSDVPIALFIGSQYGPNLEAARLILSELAPQFPNVKFVIAGGVGDGLTALEREAQLNVVLTGPVDEATKLDWLAAATVAINPMLSGSGTNIKMFDFMAAGLPILTTPAGGRGIDCAAEQAFEVCAPKDLCTGLAQLLSNPQRRSELAARARDAVERCFAWERITKNLGLLLRLQYERKTKPKPPYFTIVIPSYQRPKSRTRLAELLANQDDPRFEVIIIDQSEEPWPDRGRQFGYQLTYVHTDVRGAVMARNLGAFLAAGEVLAFSDDDCEPAPGWLAAARLELADPDNVGVEGRIWCDETDHSKWRIVSNAGVRGLGFMTANLFIRLEVFNRINGFDLAFDDPHFREDTDLGWRALEHGKIPFSENACVYHPPHERHLHRESLGERNRFFIKDALLYKKHPQRFIKLLMHEGHVRTSREYLRYLSEGFVKYGVTPGDELLSAISVETRGE
jgi:glycosyltransferase involved in cell wall biosynthesis/GT2 family glycosyltransferase